ncbi:MAG TPA: hypothetical protein VFT95_06935 [Micromonosporaceae bacterium]|nr:hypothetical protein [Micromonosporaceae bacterium]
MPVRRFLTVAALCGATALSGATAGCSKVTARWSDPEPTPTAAAVDEGTQQQAPPKRRNSLEMSAETVYFLEGVLPLAAADVTTSALAGSLVLRGQCHDGTLNVTLNAPSGTRKATVDCDGKPHEQPMGKVKVGDPLGINATGEKGTDFAIELAAR